MNRRSDEIYRIPVIFSHLEMLATMIYKLTKDATPEQLEKAGLGAHFVNHGHSLFYENAEGVPFTATYIQSKGDLLKIYMRILLQKKKHVPPINV